MKYPNNIIQPICIGNHQLEWVLTFKLLGVKIRHYVKLNDHIDYIYYTLRVCKRTGVADCQQYCQYLMCSIRSILEYAVLAWQDIPDYSYDEALTFSGLESLEKRRLAMSRRVIMAWRLRTCQEVINVP